MTRNFEQTASDFHFFCRSRCSAWRFSQPRQLRRNVVVTVVGVVTEDSQLVADDGEIYEVAASREGEAVKELLDKRVQVTGSVSEQNGIKIIEVTSYQVIK